MPHGCHIYATSADTAIATLCVYPPHQHAFSHWKCMLRCCSNCPHIDLPDQESDRHHSNTSHSISFNIYHLIAWRKLHGRHPLDEKIFFRLCIQHPATVTPGKLYTRK